MSNNINSFSQNVNRLVKSSADTLSMLGAIQQSMTTNDTFVTYEYENKDGETVKYQLPSFESVVNRLKAVESSLESLTTGRGLVNLSDGTTRSVTVSTVPVAPAQITGLADPSTFEIDSNWFFEQLMFPGATVQIDLTDKIEDSADRVRTVRIILNSNDVNAETLWSNDLSVNSYDYASLKALLAQNNVSYYEDEQTVDLPLVRNQVSGLFQVTEDARIIDGNLWYLLDTLNYSTIDSDGVDQGKNNILSIGDTLCYADSIFEVIAVNQNSNLVRLKRTSGVAVPGIYTVFNYYQDPYRSKIVNIRFGAHEYNIVYIKGIAEQSNLLSDQWSTPVKFSTDDLILNGTQGQSQMEFVNYYHNFIVDWGANMIAEAKEHKISAWYGKTPNAPVLLADDFRVVQINTQINAAIDTTDVKNTAAEIESTKSQITSLKNTIAAQKTDLQSAADLYTYNSIQQQIATNTTDLNNLQVTYTSLVDSFQTIVKENAAVLTDPKYHIRGFFPIPALKYYDEAETVAEQIIGFDICYRYIKEDSTATQLNTFTYTDGDGVSKVTGTFTDWVIVQGPMREKVYDENMQRYVWRSENIADGTETNINQVDIAISKGEKVEFRVRSISEAGYPENPLKSDWSNSVIIDFPPTLSVSNEIADLIKMVNDDALQITINNILDSVGISVHLNDVVANTNSVTGEYYKHLAKSIAYEEKKIENGITTVNSISLQDKFDEFIRTLNMEVSTNVNQQIQLDEHDRIQKIDHAAFNSSLDWIYEDVSVNVERIDRELETKVTIGEFTGIKKNLVLNASSDTVDTHVVLKSNEWKNSEGNPLSMSVMTRNADDQGGSYCGVEVSEIYVYPGGRTSETPVPLYQNILNNQSSIGKLDESLVKTQERVTELETVVPTLTRNTSFFELESEFDALKERVDEVIVDDDVRSQGAVFVNKNKVKLTTT